MHRQLLLIVLFEYGTNGTVVAKTGLSVYGPSIRNQMRPIVSTSEASIPFWFSTKLTKLIIFLFPRNSGDCNARPIFLIGVNTDYNVRDREYDSQFCKTNAVVRRLTVETISDATSDDDDSGNVKKSRMKLTAAKLLRRKYCVPHKRAGCFESLSQRVLEQAERVRQHQ